MEDRLADVANDLVQAVDNVIDPLGHRTGGQSLDALQAHAEREQPLDNSVVEVAPDSFVLGRNLQLLELNARLSQGDRDHRGVGEDLDESRVVWAEVRRCAEPSDHEGAEHPLLGVQRAEQARSQTERSHLGWNACLGRQVRDDDRRPLCHRPLRDARLGRDLDTDDRSGSLSITGADDKAVLTRRYDHPTRRGLDQAACAARDQPQCGLARLAAKQALGDLVDRLQPCLLTTLIGGIAHERPDEPAVTD